MERLLAFNVSASIAHFAPVIRPGGTLPPHERRVALALVCSGAFHAVIGVGAAAWLALAPMVKPAPTEYVPVIHATLEEWRPTPAQLDLAPLPQVVVDPVAMLAPTPAIPVPQAASAPRPSPPVTRPSIVANDPNGSVTMGLLDDPSLLGRGVAAKITDRYPQHADRDPRLIGSLIVPYPPEARQARVSGRIAAVLDIDARGTITHVTLVPDHRWFGPAVIEVLKEAHFKPAEIATNPVPYWAIVEFVFAIPPAPTS